MWCCWMLGDLDRAAMMVGMNAGLSQTRIAHLTGRSPSVVCREIARHTGSWRAVLGRGGWQGSPRGQASPEEALLGL